MAAIIPSRAIQAPLFPFVPSIPSLLSRFSPIASTSTSSIASSPEPRAESQSSSSSWSPSSLLAPVRSTLDSIMTEFFPSILLAVPKKKVSHSRKSMRSAHKGLKNKTNITLCPGCGAPKLAHNLCPECYSQINRRWKQEARAAGLEGRVEGEGVTAVA